jgi:2-polyprenyl-3-methyl-5-hydroxy-6-metoxy-1,4-benzoquinol methylase
VFGSRLTYGRTRLGACNGPLADSVSPHAVPATELIELLRTLYTSRNPTRRWLHNTRREWIESALRRVASGQPRGRALEVGPGAGLYLPSLVGLYDEVWASDVEPQYLKHLEPQARECPNLVLRADDITASGLELSSFDLVLCSEVIEHIATPRAALDTIHRLLRPGGTLVLSTPQPNSPLELASKVAFLPGVIGVVRRIYREPILPTGHISLMPSRRLETEFARAGFRVLERHKCGLYVPLFAEFGGRFALGIERRLERRLGGTRLDWLLWTQCYVAEAVPRPAGSVAAPGRPGLRS